MASRFASSRVSPDFASSVKESPDSESWRRWLLSRGVVFVCFFAVMIGVSRHRWDRLHVDRLGAVELDPAETRHCVQTLIHYFLLLSPPPTPEARLRLGVLSPPPRALPVPTTRRPLRHDPLPPRAHPAAVEVAPITGAADRDELSAQAAQEETAYVG